MTHDSDREPPGGPPDQPPQTPARPASPPEAGADLPPETNLAEDDAEERLPEPATEEADEAVPAGPLASGRAVIARTARLAPSAPGVYRMLGSGGDVLYVGKAKSVRKRLASYVRPTGLAARTIRMVAATVAVEIVSTNTETEALLLEANLIKQLRPRFNVLLRDDKSFPYILLTGDHWAPQITKYRGAQTRPGRYFGPFASVAAVNRTITALERAFLLRSCTDSFFESRTRPCLLYQIKRCSAPCTGEIDFAGYRALVREAIEFLSGRSRAVKERLAAEMDKASAALEFERAAVYRDRLAALAAIQAQQGINPRTVDEADVFAAYQEGGYFCIEVFFFRTGQNWGNRAYFPRADRSFDTAEVLGAFLSQFYEDKPPPRLVLLSHAVPEAELLAQALTLKAGGRVEVSVPRRGEKKDLVAHALTNAREALGRKLADSATQARLLQGLAERLGLPEPPRRIEVYDNSHIQGTNAVGAMIVAGAEGFLKNQYRKFNIRSPALTPGDDYAMMREVLGRRFKRLLTDAPAAAADVDAPPRWPDLVVIDGGRGQLNAARAIMSDLGLPQVALLAVAKGPERDAGRETLFLPDAPAIKLEPRDPVLYFIQRLRDEVHRFVIGSHRTLRKKDIREAGLQEIPGIGPARKRALLRHFGTLKEIEGASLGDLAKVPGISAEGARKIFDFFHPGGGSY